jgi:hypothetical protein
VVTCFVVCGKEVVYGFLILYEYSFKSFVDLIADDFKALVWAANWCRYF